MNPRPPARRAAPPQFLTLIAILFGCLTPHPAKAQDRDAASQPARPVGETTAPASRATSAPAGVPLPGDWANTMHWRSIGPAGMGGRITGIAVYEADPSTFWIATASGGLVKTVNNGVTFEHQFDHEGTVSIGAVAVAPSNKDVVWVGTGEANPRNSVSYGDGVYKSTDGGKTWTNMGLKESFQIGGIAIHPTNPDVVYVGALGRLYGPSEERGLYRTTDGGAHWERVLYADDRTGVIDVAMRPAAPDTLIVCMWERQRDEFDSHRGNPPVKEGYDGYDPAQKWGPRAGLYKTTDGGKSFKKLTQGLPAGNYGRCDVDWYRQDPRVVYAIIDCEKIGMGPPASKSYLGVTGEDEDDGVRLTRVTPESPAQEAGLKVEDTIVAVDQKPVTTWAAIGEAIRARQPGDKLPLTVHRDDETLEIAVPLGERPLSAAGAGPVAAYLGLTGTEAPDGLRVTDVPEGGPAERAGVKVDDIVRALDDEAVSGPDQLTELVRTHRATDQVVLAVTRGSEALKINVTLSERAAGPGAGGVGAFGRQGGGGGGPLGTYFGAFARERDGGGIELMRVAEDQPAERAGIEEGDILREVEGAEIKTTEALTELIGTKHEGDAIKVKIERDKVVKEFTIKLESTAASRLRPFGYMYAGQMPNVQNQQGPQGHEFGGIYRSADAGETWTRVNSLNPRPMYFSQIRVDPSDERYLYVAGVSLHRSTNGGKTFTADASNRVHADFHAMWIDARDGRHLIVGCDGGFYVTWDRTKTWEHLNHLALGQFYHVCIDSRRPYRVYGGLQDNGSWGGPSRALDGSGILNEDWISVGGGDGFVCRTDPFDPDIVYSESQDGNITRYNLKSGETARIAPRPKRGVRYRFNWNTPFIVSSHNPGIFYSGGNYVFRSVKRGDELKPISPEITRTGRGSATAIAESPLNPDVLWAGTDDGNLMVTKDGGTNWTEVSGKVGLPGPRWVATLEPSRFVEGRCYAAFDAHRSNDDEPHLYVTEDFGATWSSIAGNLPRGSTRCLREDPKNKELLYCGTEFAAWASIDRGTSWTKINGNLPTVAVHEFAFHPETGEAVVATHGRSLWIADVAPLRQMTLEALRSPAWLYEPNPVVRWHSAPSRGTGGGSQHFVGENPPRGAQITYSLTKPAEKATMRIVDYTGRTVRDLEIKKEPGLHVVTWDLSVTAARAAPRGETATRESPTEAPESRAATSRGESRPAEGARPRRGAAGRRRGEAAAETSPTTQPASRPANRAGRGPGGPGPGGPGPGGGRGGRGGGRRAPLGTYRVILEVDGKDYEKALRIEGDPTLPPELAAQIGLAEEPSFDEEEEEMREARGLFDEDEEESPEPIIR